MSGARLPRPQAKKNGPDDWCGLDDLCDQKDYWLTMYGYSAYGETYKRDLGAGDIDGLEAVYGP